MVNNNLVELMEIKRKEGRSLQIVQNSCSWIFSRIDYFNNINNPVVF